MSIDQSDNKGIGAAFTIAVGEPISVRLCRGVSDKYDWHCSNPSGLKVQGIEVTRLPDQSPRNGQFQKVAFCITADRAAEAYIFFEQRADAGEVHTSRGIRINALEV